MSSAAKPGEQVIQAKPTVYKGIEFRSRLEARSAAAFDRRGWRWRYEPDTYVAGRTGYIPDFRLANDAGEEFWIEVKSSLTQVDDDHKARQFARETRDEVLYGYEGDSFLHRPADVWESEMWVAPLHLAYIDSARRVLEPRGFLILPQFKDGEMLWPADE